MRFASCCASPCALRCAPLQLHFALRSASVALRVTLRFFALMHCIVLHCVTLRFALRCALLRCFALFFSLRCVVSQFAMRFALCCTSRFAPLRCTLRAALDVALRVVEAQCVVLRFVFQFAQRIAGSYPCYEFFSCPFHTSAPNPTYTTPQPLRYAIDF
jgi:hypothetical protein